jgi:hypothetical protein
MADVEIWPELVRRLREAHVGPRPRLNGGALGDPADAHVDAPALVRQLREAEAGMRAQPAPPIYHTLEAKLDALMALLGLSARERAFVNHLAEYPADSPTLLVFRDWLRDQRRDVEADAFAELAGEGKDA